LTIGSELLIIRAFMDRPQTKECVVSQHRSFKSASKILVKRNVLKRFERVDLLQTRGKWKEGDRGLGLPKTKPE